MSNNLDDNSKSLIRILVRAIIILEELMNSIAAMLMGVLAILFLLFKEDFSKFETYLSQLSIPSGMLIMLVSVVANLLIGRSTIVTIAKVAILRNRMRRLNIAVRSRAREIAISLTYLNHIRRESASTKVALAVVGTLCATTHLRYQDLMLLPIAVACIVMLSLILLKEMVVEYRVRNGYFGTTRSEVKDLLTFMIANSNDIDFHDDNGALRKVLLPPRKFQIDMSATNSPGQVVP